MCSVSHELAIPTHTHTHTHTTNYNAAQESSEKEMSFVSVRKILSWFFFFYVFDFDLVDVTSVNDSQRHIHTRRARIYRGVRKVHIYGGCRHRSDQI